LLTLPFSASLKPLNSNVLIIHLYCHPFILYLSSGILESADSDGFLAMMD
jgi:hypothetical protein